MEEKLRTKFPHLKSVASLPVLNAFVTFEDQDCKTRVIKKFRKANVCCGCCYPEELKHRNQYKIWAKSATEPSNILWENQEVTNCQSCCRTTFVFFIVAICMALSFTFIYLVRWYQNNKIPVLGDCSSVNVTESTVNASNSTELNCFCS